MEDAEIIALLYARKEAALTAVQEKYGPLCHRIAAGLLKDPSDVPEVVNDTYLKLWNTVPPQQPQSLQAYLCTLLRYTALTRHQHNTAQKRNHFYDTAIEELAECVPAAEGVEDALAQQELTKALNCFLKQQTETDRWLFVRRYWYGRSVTELAQEAGKTAHFVSVRLFRLRQALKKYLEQKGVCL